MDVNSVIIQMVNRCEYVFIVEIKNIYIFDDVRLSLPPVGCRRASVLFTLFVYCGVYNMLYCVCLHIAFCVPNVASSMNCPFLISR